MKSARFYLSVRHFFGELNTVYGILIAILASLFFGWFPDSVKDLCYEKLPEEWAPWILLSLSLAMLLLLIFFVWRVAQKIADIKYEVETYDESELKKVKVLIMGLSVHREDPKLGLNWSQQEVLIKQCIKEGANLERVIVVPSPKSAGQFHAFVEFLKDRTGLSDEIFQTTQPVEYEDMLNLQKRFSLILKELLKSYRERQILIDITAGTKTFSVVASSFTLDNDIRMCYVNNVKNVVIFDMVAVKGE